LVPSEIRANFDFSIIVEDKAESVPAGYTPKFVLGGAASLIKAGTAGAEDITFSFVAADTAAYTTGQYWWQIIATKVTGERVFIDEGTTLVKAAISGTGAYDGRSAAEIILEAIDATMLGKANKDQASYTIQSGNGSRSLSRLNLAELTEARKYYASIVAAEKRTAEGISVFKRHKFEFVCD
jgi:hypothetical protein